jgi:hypothetical protein
MIMYSDYQSYNVVHGDKHEILIKGGGWVKKSCLTISLKAPTATKFKGALKYITMIFLVCKSQPARELQ